MEQPQVASCVVKMILNLDVIVQPLIHTLFISSTLSYSLNIEKFLIHLFSICASLCLTLVSKITQLLDECLRDNAIATPALCHACLTSLSTCAKGVQFYCPSCTYPAIPDCTVFPFLAHYVLG